MSTYKIPMAQPDLRGSEIPFIVAAVHGRYLSMGEHVRQFEARFAARLGVQHAVATSSGTAALHLALLAAGVKPGDKVLVPTLTYVATVAAVRYCGAIPHFADVDRETWGLERAACAPANVVASLPVHLYGVPCEVSSDAIEDCAESLGATTNHGVMPTGKAGKAGVFSFYANKILTTGEGGMVVTDDAGLAEEVRLLRGQGQDPNRKYWHTKVGFNYRMTDLQAAIGLAQLERLDEMLAQRNTLYTRYVANLAGSGLTWQTLRPGTTRAPWVFACLLPRDITTGNDATEPARHRDDVMQRLADHGIETRPTFPCVHQMPPYKDLCRAMSRAANGGWVEPSYPVAEDISARGLLLPLFSEMTVDQVDEVSDRLLGLL